MSLLNLMWKLPNPVVETELTSWYPFNRAPLWLLPSSSCAVAAAPTPKAPSATNARMTTFLISPPWSVGGVTDVHANRFLRETVRNGSLRLRPPRIPGFPRPPSGPNLPAYTGRLMADVYWIGVFLGLGLGVGILLAGMLGGTRSGLLVAIGVAAVIGFALGIWLGDEPDAAAGALGGLFGAVSTGRSCVALFDAAVPASEPPSWSPSLPSRWPCSPSYRSSATWSSSRCRSSPSGCAAAGRSATQGSARSRTSAPPGNACVPAGCKVAPVRASRRAHIWSIWTRRESAPWLAFRAA